MTQAEFEQWKGRFNQNIEKCRSKPKRNYFNRISDRYDKANEATGVLKVLLWLMAVYSTLSFIRVMERSVGLLEVMIGG